MRKIHKLIRLRVLLVLLGLLIIIWSVLCVSSIRTNIGLKNPKEVTGKDSADIRSGNVVSVEYDYFFDGRFVSGFAFGRDHYYELIKLSNKEEFILCKFIGESESFLDDKTFYSLVRDIKEPEPGDKNLFLGKVRKTHKEIKEVFLEKATKSPEGLYRNPYNLSNTNIAYYIQYMEPEEEIHRLLGRITFWVILTGVWLFLFIKLRQEKSAYLFYLNEERMNKKAQHRMAVEKQLKESGKQIETVDFEGKPLEK